MEYGVLISLEDFKAWCQDGMINGVGYTEEEVYHKIQTRLWGCPVCLEEGEEVTVEHSYDGMVDVGNPICELGHDMELLSLPDDPQDYEVDP